MTRAIVDASPLVEVPTLAAPRLCPVCDADRPVLLHHNAMASIDRFPFTYPVVACEACGMVYAAQALAPAAMIDYYRDLSKYAHGEPGAFDRHRLGLAARFVRRISQGRGRLLDVGCSTGAFLAAARAEGMADVAGIEPSPAAVAVACRRGFDVRVGRAESFESYASFDIVTVLAVLEHLRDPGTFMRALASQLVPGATLVFEVPDADAFGAYDAPGVITEPFGEFSLEHINFFGIASLRRLGADAGLTLVAHETNRLANGAAALLVAYRRSGTVEQAPPVGSIGTRGSVMRYIDRCVAAMVDVDRRLATIAARDRAVIVYGAGSHTARLMTRPAFAGLRVAYIVDRNTHLIGLSMAGVRIASPDVIGENPQRSVVVSSFNASEGIVSDLRTKWRNDVVRLYDVQSVAHELEDAATGASR